jgi:CubicO group peptidase (beta-lactamase class C family)
MDSSISQKLDNFVFSRMSETKLPSATISIIEDTDKVVHSRAFGFKDVESAAPASTQTLYGIGSVTKSFTALAICKLAEEGKLDFHDPLSKHLPSMARSPFEKIEIHHLLTHTSGFPGLGWAEVQIFNALGKTKNWLPLSSIDDMASFLDEAEKWKEAEPGSKYFYLNEGYFILGAIIEKASGKSYYDFVKEKILVPLEMKRTFVSKEDVEAYGDLATPYFTEGGKIELSKVPWGSGAAGGIMSCVSDLSNYVSMYLGRGEFRGRRIISEEMIQKMETPYATPPLNLFPDGSYGYGLFVTSQFFGEKLLRHDGSVSVYTAGIAYLPAKGIGVSLLCNGSGYSPNLIALYALSLMLGKDPEKDLAPFRRENLLRKLEGVYRTYKNTISAEVKRTGLDFLMLEGEDIGSHVLVPEDQDENTAYFFTLSATAKMRVEFRLYGNSVEMIYERYKYRKEN